MKIGSPAALALVAFPGHGAMAARLAASHQTG
jgi:hypothetical protein